MTKIKVDYSSIDLESLKFPDFLGKGSLSAKNGNCSKGSFLSLTVSLACLPPYTNFDCMSLQ